MGMGEIILRDFSVERANLPLQLMGKEGPIVLNSKKQLSMLIVIKRIQHKRLLMIFESLREL